MNLETVSEEPVVEMGTVRVLTADTAPAAAAPSEVRFSLVCTRCFGRVRC